MAEDGASHAQVRRRPIQGFRDLEVYQRALALPPRVYELVLRFPEFEKFDLTSQMRRAAKSVPANIAEGYARRGSTKMFRQFLDIAIGSANEMEAHFDIARALGYVTEDEYQHFVAEYQVIGRQLRSLMRSWRSSEELHPPPSTFHPQRSRHGL